MPPGDAVRPTQDRVREALFSMLMSVVPGSAFLDLYAGSGSVGLEALSRGARAAAWVEKESRHVALLKDNVAALAAAGDVACCEVWRWVKGPGRGRGFDVAFADPPYDVARGQGFAELMGLLAGNGVVRPGGFFVAEMPEDRDAEEVPGWALLRDRTYGQTRLALYKLEKGGQTRGAPETGETAEEGGAKPPASGAHEI